MAKHHKNGASENSKTPRRRITGSALALQSCKARAKINRKMRNSTPCKIVPRENFILQLCTRDDVGAFTRYANFGFNQYNEGFSSNRRLVPFFDCPVLRCPVLTFFSILRPGRTAGKIFTLYCLFRRKDGPFGDG